MADLAESPLGQQSFAERTSVLGVSDLDSLSPEAVEAVVKAQILDELGLSLSKTRSEAIDYRGSCGIESEWQEDEEYYEGIDDANRQENSKRLDSWRSKPVGQVGLPSGQQTVTGSTVFCEITRPYVDAASARVSDMLLPTDDRPWALRPTPIPALVGIAAGKIPARINAQINATFAQDEAGIAQAEQTRNQIVEDAERQMLEAKEKAQRAEKRIEDWLTESQWHTNVRRVIDDAVKRGTGVIKGPVPSRRKTVAFIDQKLKTQSEIIPSSTRISCWDIFPDPSCGDCIHNGSYVWERDQLTRKRLEALLDDSAYIESSIRACLREGPQGAVGTYDIGDRGRLAGLTTPDRSEDLFEIWYFHGRASATDLKSAGLEVDDEERSYDVMLTMVNNHVIKAALNHLDTGEFPYDFFVWQRREGSPYGISLSRQIRTPNRIATAALRNLMDNAGLGGGPMWIFRRGVATPLNGVYEIAPRKGWVVSEDADIEDVSRAFTFLQFPVVQEELQAIIALGQKLAEDVSGMPLLMQGQQGAAPETVGGMQILNNNASTVLRRVARLFDDLVTEPHIRRYYTYLLQYGEDDEKGDFQVDARGSSALVERDIQNQQIQQMGEIAMNPVFGIDPKKWIIEHLKSQRLDPERFQYDDEEWKQIVENMSAPPPNPAVDVATIKSEALKEIEGMRLQDRERDRELSIGLNSLKHQLNLLRIEGGKQEHLDQIKTDLASLAMKLQVQQDLAREEARREALEPPTEPPGRAKPGKSFSQ